MEERRRLTLEEIDERHPELLPALRAHPHVGWLLVRSSEHGAVALGANGTHYLAARPGRGRGPARALLAARAAAPAPHRRLRARRRHHGRELLRPPSRRGLRFEELISFHGGIGGLQTRPFILHPAHLEVPSAPILGAASVHGILAGWRRQLQANLKVVESESRAIINGRSRRRHLSLIRVSGRLTRQITQVTLPGGDVARCQCVPVSVAWARHIGVQRQETHVWWLDRDSWNRRGPGVHQHVSPIRLENHKQWTWSPLHPRFPPPRALGYRSAQTTESGVCVSS